MNIKKRTITLEGEEPETVIYLFYDYFLYPKMAVNFRSKAEKIMIVLKNNTIPKNYSKHFKIYYLETKEESELKILLEKLLINKNRKKTRIISSDEEFIYMASNMAKELKIQGPSYERALNLTNKVKMKDKIRKHNIPVHNYILISKEEIKKDIDAYTSFLIKKIKFPMFLKPTESFGSRGTKKITTRKTLKSTLSEISKDKTEYELDEFISSTIINCQVAVINGKIEFFRTHILLGNLFNFSKGENYASSLVPPSHQQYKKAFSLISKIVEIFKDDLQNRCLDIELLEKNQEELLFMEFNYRRPGGKVCYLFDQQYQNGFNFEELDLDLAFGAKNVEVFEEDFVSDYAYYTAIVLFPGRKGVVRGFFEMLEGVESFVRTEYLLKKGDTMEGNLNNGYVPAYFIMGNKCFSDLYRDMQRLKDVYPYVLE